METKEVENQDTRDSAVFAFSIVLTPIVASLGIIGNGLVLIMLRNSVPFQNAKGDLIT